MAGFGVGVVAADEAGDNSSIINEEYSSEETNIDYDETNVDYEEIDNSVNVDVDTNTEITDIDDSDTIVDGNCNSVAEYKGTVAYENENTEITDIHNSYEYSDDDNTTIGNNTETYDYSYTYSDNDSTIIGNNTELYDNSYKSETVVQNTEITQVNLDNSETVSVDVNNDNSVVNNVYFVSNTNAGKANVVVEDLKPECIKKPPAGVVYKSFNIFIDDSDKQVIEIDNAAVDFKVEKSWLVTNGIDKSSIALNIYEGGKWVEVPITITSEDSQYIYFNAEVDEYSTFAITSNAITVDKVLKQTGTSISESSAEEIDEPTKNIVIKLLEVIIEILKGE